jgi:hypothetical protein
MLIHHMTPPRTWSPQPGHRAWTTPLTGYRRPPVVVREPMLPLDRKV